MATTPVLSSDIYEISDFVNTISKNFTDIDEDTLYVGVFGYLNEVLSNIAQNAIVMASEYCNESIPAKAKYEKNIITHALSLGYTDINAVPASMNILLGFMESELSDKIVNNTFTFDRESSFFIENFEFHLDYDIIITRTKLNDGSYVYSARYDMSVENPLSSITNPYLTTPITIPGQDGNVIYLQCTIRQIEFNKVYKKLLSDNIIENKVLTFDFDSQLAGFNVDYVESGNTVHLVPVYEGVYSNTVLAYCYYSYVDENTIRIKFVKDYEPTINADITINISTTQGYTGNFTYKDDLSFTFSSDKYKYANLYCSIKPISDSQFGTDKKSIDELKRIIPRESSSRGSITNTSDLENFFNMIDTDSSKTYFYKKRDNQIERLYYSYIIMKNSSNNIIPTNTIDLQINESELTSDTSVTTLGIQSGKVFKKANLVDAFYKIENPVGTTDEFRYTTPFMITINKNPLYISYYMNIFNMTKYLEFSYINKNCLLQFISTSVNWKRAYLTDRNIYKLTIESMQNFAVMNNDVAVEPTVRMFMVLYNGDKTEVENAYAYTEAKRISFDSSTNTHTYEFDFTTNDIINSDNKIRIEDLYITGETTKTYGYLNSNTTAVIYILSLQSDIPEENRGLENLSKIVKLDGVSNFTLSNAYKIVNGVDFLYNYSNIVASDITVHENPDKSVYYNILSVPVIRSNYINTETKITDLIYQLNKRKEYMDYSLSIIEDSFGLDFKFFNTYGPSKCFKIYRLGNSVGDCINSVALSMTFKVKFINKSDQYLTSYIVSDIKEYIEDITNISDMHIPNLITLITNKYRNQITYFEYIGMNGYNYLNPTAGGYGPDIQHIYNETTNDITTVPEFLNIATAVDGTPSIAIIIA